MLDYFLMIILGFVFIGVFFNIIKFGIKVILTLAVVLIGFAFLAGLGYILFF